LVGVPLSGFVSGAVGSVAGYYGVKSGLSNNLVGSFLIGGVPAAITAQITGGDPFQAFIIGGTVAAFNHYLHDGPKPKSSLTKMKEWYKKNYNKVDAVVGVVGGSLEVAGGLFSEIPSAGLSSVLVVDGAARISLNGSRLIAYWQGQDEVGDNIPSNFGGVLGKIIDTSVSGGQQNFNQTGIAQITLGAGNDLGIFLATGGSGGAFVSPARATMISNIVHKVNIPVFY